MEGRRRHARIDAHPLACCFQPQHQILHALGRYDRLELTSEVAPGVHEELVARLDVGAVEHPGVARHDPADPVRIDPLLQQPDAGIHSRLAGSDDDMTGLRLRDPNELVRRNTADAGSHRITRRRRRRDLHAGMRPVDHLLANLHRLPLPGHQRFDLVRPHDPTHGQESHPARGQETLLHDLVEVGDQLGATR